MIFQKIPIIFQKNRIIPVLFPMIPNPDSMMRLFFRIPSAFIPNDAPIIFEKLKNAILARLPEKYYNYYK
jgi:RsiW-degrading membrane proteinase PrsW (M82 family)